MSVAVEQHFPPDQRVVQDELAQRILPAGMRACVRLTRVAAIRDWVIRTAEKRAPGIWGGVLCRKRYIDDRLTESVARLRAVVDLGAGFDTRAYRLPALATVPVWEVDQTANIAAKRDRIIEIFESVPAHVTLVTVDLDREQLGATLARSGFAQREPAFYLLEAVTQYLIEPGVAATFSFLQDAASGSRLAFTYIVKSFIDGRELFGQPVLRRRYVDGKIWLWGIEPVAVPGFLERHGWRVLEHPTYEELGHRYTDGTGRALASTTIERIVYAEKM